MVNSTWSWLLAFNAVAAAEHLPTAAQTLGVVPSALSRSVRALEQALAKPLFIREGGTLQLNADGRRLAGSVYRAIELIRRGLGSLQTAAGHTLRISAAVGAPYAAVAADIQPLIGFERWKIKLRKSTTTQAVARLLDGSLEVHFTTQRVTAQGCVSTYIGSLRRKVYAPSSHPLLQGERSPSTEQVLASAFVAPRALRKLGSAGKEPLSRATNIHGFIARDELALTLVLSQDLMAVLPQCEAQPFERKGVLREVEFAAIRAVPLFAVWCPERASASRVEPLLERLQHERGTSKQASAKAGRPIVDGWLRAGDTLCESGQLAAGELAYRHAYQARGENNSTDDFARYAERVARLMLVRGRYREVVEIALLALGREIGSPMLAAQLAASISMARSSQGRLPAAQAWAERASELASLRAPIEEQQRARAYLCRSMGNLLMTTGLSARAVIEFERGQKLCQTLGDAWEHSIATYNLAEAHARLSEFEQAEHLLDRALHEKVGLGDGWGQAHVLLLHVNLLLATGRATSATAQLNQARHLAKDSNDSKLLASIELAYASDALSRGLAAIGLEAARAARAFAAQSDSSSARVRSETMLAIAASRAQKPKLALKAVQRARSIARKASVSAQDRVLTLTACGDVLGRGPSCYREAIEAGLLKDQLDPLIRVLFPQAG